jgi:ElaB/YqjD/DUF883 family membrane-anchored ribosome-binding protein
MEREREKHESYGLMGFSRTSGSNTNLFGSSIKHQNTIRMTLKTAVKDRSLNRDWFHGQKQIVEVEMSQNQFAELITSLNMGDGVPVTIRYINGVKMEDCPEENKRQLFEKEFEDKMLSINEKLKRLTEETERILNDKAAPKKSDKELILKQIQMLHQEVVSNIPFVSSQFNEQMDKTVAEAKAEVEAFVQHKVTSLGIEGLKAQMLMLNDGINS